MIVRLSCMLYKCSETNLGELLVDLKVIITTMDKHLQLDKSLTMPHLILSLYPLGPNMSPFYKIRKLTQGRLSNSSSPRSHSQAMVELRFQIEALSSIRSWLFPTTPLSRNWQPYHVYLEPHLLPSPQALLNFPLLFLYSFPPAMHHFTHAPRVTAFNVQAQTLAHSENIAWSTMGCPLLYLSVPTTATLSVIIFILNFVCLFLCKPVFFF